MLTVWLETITGESISQLDTAGWSVPSEAVAPGRRGVLLPPLTAPRDGAGAGYGYTASTLASLARFAADSLADRDRLEFMTGVHPTEGQTLTGLGWRVTPHDTGERVWHTGTVPGYFAAVHLLPEQDLGVVFWVNRSGYLDEQRLYDVSAGLLEIALGGETELPGPAATKWIALGMGAVLAGAAVLLAGRGGRVARGAAWALALLLLVSPAIAVLAMGVPWRYLALWLPDVALALFGLGIVAALGVGIQTLRRRRRIA